MSDPAQRDPSNAGARPLAPLRTVQLVVGALVAGCLSLAGVAVALNVSGSLQTQPGLVAVLAPVWGVLGMAELVAWVLVRGALLKQARAAWERGARDADAARAAMARFAVLQVIRGALAEGWALFAGVIFLITGAWPMLGGVAAGVGILLIGFPTQRRLERFLESASLGQIRSSQS